MQTQDEQQAETLPDAAGMFFNLVLSEGGLHYQELHSMTVRKNKKKKF